MAYYNITRLEVRMMYIGQGMANVVCGYKESGDIEYLSFLMVCDFGSECGSSKDEIGLSVDELKALMTKRADDEKTLKQLDVSKTFEKIKSPDNIDALVDVFVLSHADEDHYSLLEKLIKRTKCLTRTEKDTVNAIIQKKIIPLSLSNFHIAGQQPDNWGYNEGYYNIWGGIFHNVSSLNDMYTYEFMETHRFVNFELKELSLEISHFCCSEENTVKNGKRLDKTRAINFSFCKNDSSFLNISFSTNAPSYDTSLVISEKILNTYTINANTRLLYPYNFEIYLFLTKKFSDTRISIRGEFTAATVLEFYCEILKKSTDFFNFHAFSCFDDDTLQELNNILQKLKLNIKSDDVIQALDQSSETESFDNEEYSGLIDGDVVPFDDNTVVIINDFICHDCLGDDKTAKNKIKFFTSKSVYNKSTNGGIHDLIVPSPLAVKIISPILNSLDSSTDLINVSPDTEFKRNMHSQATIINAFDFRFVFPGDPTAHTMHWIYNTSENKNCVENATVLSAPHHGSWRTAKCSKDGKTILEEYLNVINPHNHIISSGKENRFFHPKHEYVKSARSTKHIMTPAQYPHQIYKESGDGSKLMTFEDELNPLYTTVAKIAKNLESVMEEKKVSYMFNLGSAIYFKYYTPNDPHIPLTTPPVRQRLSFSQFTHEHRGGGLWI